MVTLRKYQVPGMVQANKEPRSRSLLSPPTFRLTNLTDHPLERDLSGSLDALFPDPNAMTQEPLSLLPPATNLKSRQGGSLTMLKPA